MYQKHLHDLLKQIGGPHPHFSDSVSLEWGPPICISNNCGFLVDATGPGLALSEPVI